jgi:hypothetical protein
LILTGATASHHLSHKDDGLLGAFS